MIMNRTYIIILLCSLWTALPIVIGAQTEKKDFTVVIDPGHGGRDPGAIGKRGKDLQTHDMATPDNVPAPLEAPRGQAVPPRL